MIDYQTTEPSDRFPVRCAAFPVPEAPMPGQFRRSSLLPLILSVLISSVAVAQSGVASLRDTPAAHFTPEDFSLVNAAESELLKDAKPGEVKTWANAATGHHGTIKLMNSFKSTAGRDCRRLLYENHTRTLRGVTTTNLCYFPDGRWLIDADATPQT